MQTAQDFRCDASASLPLMRKYHQSSSNPLASTVGGNHECLLDLDRQQIYSQLHLMETCHPSLLQVHWHWK